MKFSNNHTLAICNDNSINVVPLPPAEPSEFNVFGTVVRLSPRENQMDPLTNTHTQTISNSSIIPQDDIDNAPRTKTTQTNDQFNIQFTNKVFGNITKITQAHNTSQEKTRNL